MEFPTNINKYLKVNDDGFIICTGKNLLKQILPHFINQGTKVLSEIINVMGQNSAKAQGLKQIITTYIKFHGCDHRIYIKVENNKAIGFLRTGEKKLFYHDNMGQIKQLTPTCVLDIYVHQSYQRTGIGKQIFECFLNYENKVPEKLAYDRPSPKLIGFLKKHYGLSKFIPQNNNFVIFDQYFSGSSSLLNKHLKTQQQVAMNDLNNNNNNFNTTNRFYKYDNKKQLQLIKPQTIMMVQNKNLNKTLPTNIKKQEMKITGKQFLKGEKIQDSLSLLQKEMNRMHLNNTITSISAKQIKKQTDRPIGSIQDTASQMKGQLRPGFGSPWATEQNISFRTTSGSYGSHYNRYK